MNYYHPDTLEHIRNPLPAVAEWAGETALAPPAYDPATEVCRFVAGAWAVTPSGPSLDDAKQAKIIELKGSCRAACFAGYTSSALGSPHFYDTEQDAEKNDQVNLTAIHSDACNNLNTPGWVQKITCTEVATGIKSRKEHTAAQARDVALGAKAMIEGNLETLWSKIGTISAATDVAAVDAVVW